MTELPDVIELDTDIMSTALASFERRPDLIETLIGKFPTLQRDKAEDLARRMSMSASVCVAAGLTAMQDMLLFERDDWQEMLTTLLFVFDTAPKDEPRFSDS